MRPFVRKDFAASRQTGIVELFITKDIAIPRRNAHMSIADVLSRACLFDKIISLILSFHITDNPIECIFRELAAYHIRRTPWEDIRTQTEGQRGFAEFAELHLYQFRIVFPPGP